MHRQQDEAGCHWRSLNLNATFTPGADTVPAAGFKMAAGRRRRIPTMSRRERREPRLDSYGGQRGLLDLGLSPEDRAGGARAQRGKTRDRSASDRTGADPDPPARGRRTQAEYDGAPARSGRGKARKRGAGRRGRSFLGHVAYLGVVLAIWGFIAVAGLFIYHAAQLPPIDQLAVPKRPPNIAIVAADGSALANRGDTGGRAVSIKELPPYLPNAFIAIEDRRFRDHYGVDPIGIARAAMRNITSRGVAQGGSTLTQQLAKNLFLTQERTAARKIQEAILALWLERTFTKDQILELYLNRVYFGSGAYGVEAASLRYFGKPARAVTIAEAAMLAGLVQAPARLAPNRNPQAAQARAQLVVAAMAREGYIAETAAKTALVSPAHAVRGNGAASINYAADYVMDVLDDIVGAVETDIVVTTTIDPRIQSAAEKALTEDLDKRGQRLGVSQGAVVTLAADGSIRALVGGRNYAESQFNRASQARRQPGSAFKPFVYLAALERGLTPDSVREDSPVNIQGWQPENYSRDYRGPVRLSDALAQSLNTVAVRLGVEVGPRNVARVAQRLGVNSGLAAQPSLALGTSEVTPLELTAAYTAFANGGTGVVPHIITRVATVDGRKLFERRAGSLGRVVEPAQVAQMNAMLRETMVAGTARRSDFNLAEAAGKTGTSQDFRDAWFVGYTSQYVTAVWVGNDDNSPSRRASGATMPLDIWGQVMKAAHQGRPASALPGGPFRPGVSAPLATPVAGGLPPGLDPARDGGSGTGTLARDVNARELRPPAGVSGRPTPAPAPEPNLFQRLFGG